jgi:hypothetical protein
VNERQQSAVVRESSPAEGTVMSATMKAHVAGWKEEGRPGALRDYALARAGLTSPADTAEVEGVLQADPVTRDPHQETERKRKASDSGDYQR